MRKILIIDDNKYIRFALSALIEEAGFEPLSAEDCNAALDIIKKNKPGLVMLEKKLPDCDGISLVEKIKAVAPDLPVIMLSAYSDITNAEIAINKGAYAFITKPFDNDEIIKLIKNALNQTNNRTD